MDIDILRTKIKEIDNLKLHLTRLERITKTPFRIMLTASGLEENLEDEHFSTPMYLNGIVFNYIEEVRKQITYLTAKLDEDTGGFDDDDNP